MRASGASVPGAGNDRDLAALQQRLEAADEPVDDRLLAHLRLGELDRRRRRVHAELGRALHRAQHLGGLEQLLGRDAPAVQAGAAEPLLFDDGDAACPPTRRRARPRNRPDHRRARRDRTPARRFPRARRRPLWSSSAAHQLHRERRENHETREPREDDVRARAHAARLAAARRHSRFGSGHEPSTPAGTMLRSWLNACSESSGWLASCPSPRAPTRSARASPSAGITAYAFLSLAYRQLTTDALDGRLQRRLRPLGRSCSRSRPGFFQPLEQEVGRALAHRRAQGIGGAPLVKRAATLGGILALAAIVVCLAAMSPITSRVFHHNTMLFVVAAHRHRRVLRDLHRARHARRATAASAPYGTMLARRGHRAPHRDGRCSSSSAFARRARTASRSCCRRSPRCSSRCAARSTCSSPDPTAPYSELSTAIGYLLARLGALPGAVVLGVHHGGRAREAGAVESRRQVRGRHPDRAHPDPRLPGGAGRAAPEARAPRRRGRGRRVPQGAPPARDDRARGRASSAWSAASPSGTSPGRLLFGTKFTLEQPRRRPARGRQRRVHLRPHARPGVDRAAQLRGVGAVVAGRRRRVRRRRRRSRTTSSCAPSSASPSAALFAAIAMLGVPRGAPAIRRPDGLDGAPRRPTSSTSRSRSSPSSDLPAPFVHWLRREHRTSTRRRVVEPAPPVAGARFAWRGRSSGRRTCSSSPRRARPACSRSAQPAFRTAIAFVCFCLAASSTYFLNDAIDVEADRRHPTQAQPPGRGRRGQRAHRDRRQHRARRRRARAVVRARAGSSRS